MLATRLSRQLHSALVAQPRRQRCAARCCVISPLLDGVPSAPSRRRLHAPLVTSPSREQFVLRDADRGCTHVLVWRTGFPHAQFAVPGTARRSSIPGSWIRGACVVAGRGSAPRPDRTGGGSPPTSRGAKHPRLVRGSGVIQVRFRGSRAPLRGVGASRLRLRRRCGVRRGGSVTRSGIGTLAERIRFAQRTVHGRSPLRSTECEHSPPDRMTSRSTQDRPLQRRSQLSAGVDSKAGSYDWTHHDSRGEAAS